MLSDGAGSFLKSCVLILYSARVVSLYAPAAVAGALSLISEKKIVVWLILKLILYIFSTKNYGDLIGTFLLRR